MDSVRYLSYHQWRTRKEGDEKPLQYHQKLLANVESLQNNVSSIDKLITEYLDATKNFCGAGSHLAEAFSLVLKDTPLLEITQQLKQVVEEVDHVAHKSSVHIINHILGTLCEFTATFPDLKRAIEAHKRSAQNYEACQENLEALDKDESLLESSKRFKIAKKRFRSADEELSTEEENLYRSFTEIEENRIKMLGSCFLSLLQVQSQFLTASSELMSPLGCFQEIGDYLRDREVTLALKDATSAWLSLAQANQSLRQGKGLTREDIQLLMHSYDEELPELERKQLASTVEVLLKNYQKEFQRAPTPEADIPGGFHKHPRGAELALQGCCSETEALAAGGQQEVVSEEQMEAEILKQIPKLLLKIGTITHEACPSPSKAPDNLKSKLHCIRELVNKVATHNDIPLNKENLDYFVLSVLYEACSPICVSSAKTAVQLLFGRANLVTVKPCKDSHARLAQVSVKSTSVHVEVLSTWSITANQALFSCISRDLDLNTPLGTVEATFVVKFSLMDFLEDKERPLPTIYIKRYNNPQSPQSQPKQESSPCHKQNRFRKSLTKATSKIFSRKSGQGAKATGNAANPPESPSSNSVPSTGTGSPGNEGFRMSLVTSSTDTSNEHDTDIEGPPPLPPPRPKHWARKVQAQNMGLVGEQSQEHKKSDDWYQTDPKFPLPKFKPTLSDSQSQLSVASQQELDEVIKFLSGTPLKSRPLPSVDNVSHVTPADSGLGSSLSIACSSITQASMNGGVEGTSLRLEGGPIKTPRVEVSEPAEASRDSTETPKETKKDSKSRKGKNKQDSETKKENNKTNSESKGKKSSKKSDKSVKSQDVGKTGTEGKENKNDTKKKTKVEEPKSKDGDQKTEGGTEEKKKEVEQKEKKKEGTSPVVVTVSSVDDVEQENEKKVTISESLRSVWENADPAKKRDNGGGALQSRPKEKYGSQETLYHSCWSLSEFDGTDQDNQKDEDTRSLNENMLPSNASPVMDLGLKWSPGFAHDVWSSNPNIKDSDEMENDHWCRSDETLDKTSHGGKNVFSLGLGITGPELFAAASQAGRDDYVKENCLAIPEMTKPRSAEDLSCKRENELSLDRKACMDCLEGQDFQYLNSQDPWPKRSASPSPHPHWTKTASLNEDSHRQSVQRQTLPPQHYSDPFLPHDHWWNQVGAGLPHPSNPRYQQYLQRQYSVDVNFQGVQSNPHGGYSSMGLSAFHPVQPRFAKVRPAHLQVPPHYPNGNGSSNNHHASNPRF